MILIVLLVGIVLILLVLFLWRPVTPPAVEMDALCRQESSKKITGPTPGKLN